MKRVTIRTSTHWLFAMLLAVFAIGCASSDGALRQDGDIISQLENEGLALIRTGMSSIDVFTVPGERFQVGAGGTLHLFEYNDENRAALDVSRVDAGIMSNAHVYQVDSVVAVYVGENLGVRSAISNVFGAELF